MTFQLMTRDITTDIIYEQAGLIHYPAQKSLFVKCLIFVANKSVFFLNINRIDLMNRSASLRNWSWYVNSLLMYVGFLTASEDLIAI